MQPIFRFCTHRNLSNCSLSFTRSYLNFVECLRYLSDEIVTDELMDYAESLITGFDDTVDDPTVGKELKPTFVNIREIFHAESVLGRGMHVIMHSL